MPDLVAYVINPPLLRPYSAFILLSSSLYSPIASTLGSVPVALSPTPSLLVSVERPSSMMTVFSVRDPATLPRPLVLLTPGDSEMY